MNTIGENYRVTTFGESHGPALGVVIDGVRPGIPVDLQGIQRELLRRRPGTSRLHSPRNEGDDLEVLSGIFEGRTTGAPIAFLFRNRDACPTHYESLKDIFRPGHADITWWRKYGIRDWRGGGRSSGRETVARVAAGALARQILEDKGISIAGHVVRIGSVLAHSFDPAEVERNPVRCADPRAAAQMIEQIERAQHDGDSVGGVVEIVAEGVPPGWGDPVFGKLDALLGAAMLSIGAVKGIEIGGGFSLAERRGSEANDEILPDGFATNNMGGVLGGISNGAPIVVRIAVKPTPSIAREQKTIDTKLRPTTVSVPGRHDPCICPRIVPVAEAMVAVVLCDTYLRHQALSETAISADHLRAELSHCDGEILRLLCKRREILRQSREETFCGLSDVGSRTAENLGLDAVRIKDLFERIGELAGG